MNLDEVKDKWLVCSTLKHGFAHNSLLFWGKNNCGHYADLENCEFYTEQDAKSHCYKGSQNIAIPVRAVLPYLKTQVVDSAGELLREWSR